MFKVVKQTDDGNEEKSKSSISSHDVQEVFSMNQLINKGQDFLKNQIFTTNLDKNNEKQEKEQFTYV